MTTLQIRRFASPAALDKALIERLQESIHTPAAERMAIMLSGGKTPLPAYRELARRGRRAPRGLHLLYSDDRYVPPTSEASNYFQSRALLEALGLPQDAVLRVHTELPLEEAAADYERQLSGLLQSGVRIGLGLLGLGADGHTASLFTSEQLEQARGRLAIAVHRPDAMAGISVTPELLSQVDQPLFLAAGPDKHAIVDAFLRSDSQLTARRAIAGCPVAEIWIAP
ncbi:MAG TPA: 6-phosphogluconolactonase [Steroidobacteraceae bacterium]